MRALKLAITFLAIALSPQIWLPAWAVSAPNYTLSCAATKAGANVPCTINRADTSRGIYVLVETSDNTAKAGIDYSYIRQLLYMPSGQASAVAYVPTKINPAATGDLTFAIALASSAVDLVRSAGTILESPVAPVTAQWVPAPLQDGAFAKVKANDSLWSLTGGSRALVPGEIVAVYFNGWGSEADGKSNFAVYALADGASARVLASDLAGVAPVGTPPALPAGWWQPGLVSANKTCTDPRAGHEGQPGTTQDMIYRAAMLAGSHKALAVGQTGTAGSMWLIFGTGDQTHAAATVANGDCLTGSS